MGQITDPALLAELDGGSSQSSGGRVTDAALLAELDRDEGAPEQPQNAPQTPVQGQGDIPGAAQQPLTQGVSQGATKLAGSAFTDELQARIARGDDLASVEKFSRDNGFDPATFKGLAEAVEWRRRNLPGESEVIATQQVEKPVEVAKPMIDNGDGAFGAGVRGFVDTATLGLLDEAGAVVDSLGLTDGRDNVWNSDKSWGDLYEENRDKNRAIMDFDEANHFGARLTGQLAGGFVLPVGRATSVGRMALEGAALGGAYGYGSGRGDAGEQIKSTITGTVAGGALGGVAGAAVRALGGLRPTQAATQGREVLDAASRLTRDGIRVRPLPADVGGDVTRTLTSVANQGVLSGALIGRKAGRYGDAIQDAALRAADDLRPGNAGVSTFEEAASAIGGQNALGGARNAARREADALYGQAEQLAGGATVPTPATLQTLTATIQRLERVPGGVQGVQQLRQLRADLARGEHSIESLRALRTSFGDNFDVTNRTAREAARELWAPLSADIRDGLIARGRQEAADAYQVADQAYAASREHLRNVVNPIMGRADDASDQQVATKLMGLLRSNVNGFTRTLDSLTPDLAGNARGAIVREMGMANGEFMPAVFARNWTRLGNEARNAIAPAGSQARQDLDDVATLMGGVRAKGQFNNHSNTGRVASTIAQITSFTTGGLATLGKTLALELGAGSVLGSNKVARTMTRAGEYRPVSRGALNTLANLPRQQSTIKSITDD